jgi:hypothetical protein
MINERAHHRWTVYGRGGVSLYNKTSVEFYRSGTTFRM